MKVILFLLSFFYILKPARKRIGRCVVFDGRCFNGVEELLTINKILSSANNIHRNLLDVSYIRGCQSNETFNPP